MLEGIGTRALAQNPGSPGRRALWGQQQRQRRGWAGRGRRRRGRGSLLLAGQLLLQVSAGRLSSRAVDTRDLALARAFRSYVASQLHWFAITPRCQRPLACAHSYANHLFLLLRQKKLLISVATKIQKQDATLKTEQQVRKYGQITWTRHQRELTG